MQTLTLRKELSEGLKIRFIDESVVLYNLKNISTSDKPIDNKINIETSSPEMLNLILSRIYTTGLNIKVNNPTDTVIILD
ncbi:hypothetical protein L21SP5_00418 [Salinivirga cyanobacteriivorans]|uniref:Uncharacterized protein n=1 Tax=Salinivirga cyanobacteriivorans TaxID=1307839 RepID=A0A0S2HVM0_9BACT|nr:hypothetical protein [Salinivirga cyanobacteriivorans]ALO14097.1 hypothetical protein L21SP5_00418 [Salinivirga cyanobacteriivorans]